MKLLAKTSWYYLFLSVPVLVLSGFICYRIITKEVKQSNDELLSNRKELIQNYLQKKDTVLLQLITQSKEAQIKKLSFNKPTGDVFSDTLIFDRKEKELAENRVLTSYITLEKNTYQIKIWRSTLEFEELFEGIATSLTILLALLFLTYLIINFWISKTLWKPFYNTVSDLKNFRASDNSIPNFDKTSVTEFKTLHDSLHTMMEKMMVDYTAQKKFTENASHEIQTPLAVIKSKIDLLIQSQNLKENEVQLITSIDDACTKLIRLNKTLLLLTKIENRQFKTTEKISIEKTVDNSLALFEEYIQANNIHVIKNTENDFSVYINPDLCSVLINNLLQNAIRHNTEGGNISIFIKHNCLSIQNSGKEETLDTNSLFERFQKKSNSQQSLGLGLAIAKEIAEINGLTLKYTFTENKHCFTLSTE